MASLKKSCFKWWRKSQGASRSSHLLFADHVLSTNNLILTEYRSLRIPSPSCWLCTELWDVPMIKVSIMWGVSVGYDFGN
jgi:hypothetical protein